MTETRSAPDRLDVLALEMRAGFAETRVAIAELRHEMINGFAAVNGRIDGVNGRIDGVDAKVETVIDALADFRQEYHQHTHEQ